MANFMGRFERRRRPYLYTAGSIHVYGYMCTHLTKGSCADVRKPRLLCMAENAASVGRTYLASSFERSLDHSASCFLRIMDVVSYDVYHFLDGNEDTTDITSDTSGTA